MFPWFYETVMQSFKSMRKIPIPLAQRLIDIRRGPMVLLVWLAVAGAAMWMLMRQPLPASGTAWVPPTTVRVTAPSDGRIVELNVRPSQFVRRGDVVGRLDDSDLMARLETELARAEEMRASLSAAEAAASDEFERAIQARELDRADEMRRYAGDLPRYTRDEASLALEVLGLEVQVSLDEVQVELLALRKRRAKGLAEVDAGPVAEAEDLDLLQRRMEHGLDSTRALLAQAQIERDAATARREAFVAQAPVEFQVRDPVDTLAGFRAAVQVQLLEVAEIRVSMAGLLLVAPLDGFVRELLLADGQNVRSGDPIMLIVGENAGDAMVFLDAARWAGLDLIGCPVELRRLGWGGVWIEFSVGWVSPHVELMPERLWHAPDEPRYGRAVMVPLGDGHPFIPGEVLGVQLGACCA